MRFLLPTTVFRVISSLLPAFVTNVWAKHPLIPIFFWVVMTFAFAKCSSECEKNMNPAKTQKTGAF
jgi:hypothetical protein